MLYTEKLDLLKIEIRLFINDTSFKNFSVINRERNRFIWRQMLHSLSENNVVHSVLMKQICLRSCFNNIFFVSIGKRNKTNNLAHNYFMQQNNHIFLQF